jgi:hypothetical protein
MVELERTLKIAERTIYFRETQRGWAIVVIPDNFKVDNYYHGVHIHPDRKELPIKDPQMIYKIVFNHISREGKIKDHIIRRELGL